MAKERAEHKDRAINIGYKVVSLIAIVIAVAGSLVGGTIWVASVRGDLQVVKASMDGRMTGLEKQMVKILVMVEKDRDLLNQYGKVMIHLEQQGEAIRRLQEFASKGERFTPKDLLPVLHRVEALEDWTKEAPPDWFEEQINKFMSHTERSEERLFEEINAMKIQLASITMTIENHMAIAHEPLKKKGGH